MLRVGKVLKSNGTDGELLLSFFDIAPEDIDREEPVFIYFDGLPVPFYFDSFKPRGTHRALARLTGIRSLQDADELAGCAVYADYFEEQEAESFIGWTIRDAQGQTVGTATEYEDIPGNLCLWVDTEKGQVLLPLHENLILAADTKRRILTLEIPEGLL